jgi:hypothetical protein
VACICKWLLVAEVMLADIVSAGIDAFLVSKIFKKISFAFLVNHAK